LRRGVWLSGLGRDVRIAFRRFRSNPGFVATAVLSLAIGIGANTAIFTLVNALLVRDQPYEAPDRLYEVYLGTPDFAYGTFSYPDLMDLKEGAGELLSYVPASQFTIVQRQFESSADVEVLAIEVVNGDYFEGLGVRAAVGRVMGSEDDVSPGAHAVVMLGWSYWQRAFDGDPGVIGSDIVLTGRPYTIIGVAPKEFQGALRGLVPDLFAPILMLETLSPTGDDPFTERGNHAIFAKARLADGVTLPALETRLAGIVSDLRTRGTWSGEVSMRLLPTRDVLVFPPVDRYIRMAAWMLSAVVALVLLIACANLASFLLAKAVDRRREMAVQLSLGATRGTLVRQLMIETVLLGLVAGVAGLAASTLGLRALLAADLPLPLPLTLDLSPDATVLGYSLLVSALAGAIFGLAPALLATRTQIVTVLREETPGSGRRGRVTMRGLLVGAQVAVTLVLLATAGLLLRSFRATQTVDPGFGYAPSALVTMTLRADRWSDEEGLAFLDRMYERFREVPGVRDVAVAGRMHLDPLNNWNSNIVVEGITPPPGRDSHQIDWTPVDPPFFDVTGVRIVEGRNFEQSDRSGAQRVAIVNETMARRFWPDADAIGSTFRYPSSGNEVTVVGIASDAKVRQIGEAPRSQFYRPFAQAYSSGFTVIATVSGDAERTAQEIARAARDLDPDVFTWEPKSMERHLATQLLARRLAAWVVSAFAVLGLLLASVGLYGLVSYSVAQRRREVGIRMSLGADRASIVRLLLGNGLRPVVAGVFAGLGMALALARLLQGLLYGVSAFDAATFGIVVTALLSIAGLAAALPAFRATRVDPSAALRVE
jgi:predicted permease